MLAFMRGAEAAERERGGEKGGCPPAAAPAGAPESEGEGSVDLEGLQSEHSEAIEELKARMNAEGVVLTPAATVGSAEHTLRRFLISCDWNVGLALEKVRRMLAWRAANRIDTILERVLEEEKLAFLRGEMPTSHHGFDLRGNPVHLEQPGRFRWGRILDRISREDLIHMHIFLMEYQFRVLMPQGAQRSGRVVDKMTNIVDLSGLNLGILQNLRAISLFKEVQRIDQDYYPDHVRRIYLVNPPLLFRPIWHLIKRVMPNNEHHKVKVLPGYEKAAEVLSAVLEPESVPRFFGGCCNCEGGCLPGRGGTGTKPTVYQYKMAADVARFLAEEGAPSVSALGSAPSRRQRSGKAQPREEGQGRRRGRGTLDISARYSAWGGPSPPSSVASATVGAARGFGRRTRLAFAWLRRTGATVLVHKALPLQRHRKAKYI